MRALRGDLWLRLVAGARLIFSRSRRLRRQEDTPILGRYGEGIHPIARFINRAEALGLTRSDLARRLGYRDLGKAHQVLTVALRAGTVPSHMAKHLVTALEVDDRLLAAVLETTAGQQRDEARAQALAREAAYRTVFRPHLRCETARIRPEPLFVAALVGVARLRHVPLPDDTWQAGAERRDLMVKRAIRKHYEEQEGSIPTYGAIFGYCLVTLPGYEVDFGTPYDLNGDPAGPMCAVPRLTQPTMGIKRGDARLIQLLKDVPVKTIQNYGHQ